jgi:hypothetical protein
VRTVLTVVLLVTVVLLTVAVALLRQQRDAALADAGEDRAGRAVVVVDVRNAHDLAARRTQFARALSLVAPGMTRSLVHREVIRQLKGELAQQGVLAQIQVRRWPSSATVSEVDEVEPGLLGVTPDPSTDGLDDAEGC